MLKQHNFQVLKPKRRKLYTPLSDEDENFECELIQEKAVYRVEEIKNNLLKTSIFTEKYDTKSTNEQNIAVQREIDEDEKAENFVWKIIKPTFRKNAVKADIVWKHNYLRFNSMKMANERVLHKKNKSVEIHDNYDHIMDILTKGTAAKKTEHNSNQINASIVRNEQTEEEKISYSSKNRLYSVVEIQQPHSSNDFSIKNLRSTINCDVLNNIFSQYEIKGKQNDQNIEKIDSSIKDSFICSQFLDKTLLNIHENEAESDCGDKTKILINTTMNHELLNDLLEESSPKKCDVSCDTGLFSRSSLLSESSKRIKCNGSLAKCLL